MSKILEVVGSLLTFTTYTLTSSLRGRFWGMPREILGSVDVASDSG